jgi:hypothetical protein
MRYRLYRGEESEIVSERDLNALLFSLNLRPGDLSHSLVMQGMPYRTKSGVRLKVEMVSAKEFADLSA